MIHISGFSVSNQFRDRQNIAGVSEQLDDANARQDNLFPAAESPS
jgi:hypothetical protein